MFSSREMQLSDCRSHIAAARLHEFCTYKYLYRLVHCDLKGQFNKKKKLNSLFTHHCVDNEHLGVSFEVMALFTYALLDLGAERSMFVSLFKECC